MTKLEQAARPIEEALKYNSATGLFTWLRPTNRRVKIGDYAGSIGSEGYVNIMYYGKQHKAHRLAWLFVHGKYPDGQIDHINQDRTDNRIANLRVVTNSENQLNRKASCKSKSQFIGVSWKAAMNKWCAQFKKKHIGYFASEQEASNAYQEYRRNHV